MNDLVKLFRWQSGGAMIRGRLNESLLLRVRWQREHDALARCDQENGA